MQTISNILGMLFGPDSELRGIIGVTLQLSLTSTLIACCIGIPLGVIVGSSTFRGKKLVLRLTHTLMGLPPVVAGLVVFFLLSRSGPLGHYKLLYSVTAMVAAQVLIITPIAAGLAASMAGARAPLLRETAAGINLSGTRRYLYTLYECRHQLISVVFTGFGRAISEVGAAMMVGGNIQYKTRIMTTAIVLETNMGYFQQALALGILLLIISFIITSLAHFFLEGRHDRAV
jgi:tungstate transport system permease protein